MATEIGQWLDEVKWNNEGLVPAIAQDVVDGQVLMMAWMNREALSETRRLGEAVYWSRSRGQLWHKGEQSGNVQQVHEVRLDCDGDTVLLRVSQRGGVACHTGRRHCFFRRLDDRQWQVDEPVLTDPATLYPTDERDD